MTKETLQALVSLAKAKKSEIDAKEKLEREAANAAAFATTGDKAKVYVEQLLEEIKQGSLVGKTEYVIRGLPQDCYVSGSFDSGTQKAEVITNSVMDIVFKAVKDLGLFCHYDWTPHSSFGDWGYRGSNYEVFINVRL